MQHRKVDIFGPEEAIREYALSLFSLAHDLPKIWTVAIAHRIKSATLARSLPFSVSFIRQCSIATTLPRVCRHLKHSSTLHHCVQKWKTTGREEGRGGRRGGGEGEKGEGKEREREGE